MNPSSLMTNNVPVINLCFMFIVLSIMFASVNPSSIPSSPKPTYPLYNICDNSKNVTSNSTYEKNLNTFLKALLTDTPSLLELLKEHVHGSDPYKVYGLSQCFFLSLYQATCTRCIQNAINQTSIVCTNAIGAKMFCDECVFVYGAQNLSSSMIHVAQSLNFKLKKNGISNLI
ncbi:hypothetical protein O6H91_04G035300 [Diphasiastrum complanatum]|uniref:Uncharacterized protein n=1 Tax=Diphasiastrum complanatum TaxID=34168 RepID=A0ACC2DVV8_DIPCM|nr:hypothetical protein O6H91_04G035300 [Diphasiastrum complanatum]